MPDVVAHNLRVIIVQATAADEVFNSDPDDARRAVRTIGGTARRALGMRERAATFGGRVEAGPDAGGGFRVVALLPVAVGER